MTAVRYRKNPPTLSSKEPIKLQEYLRFQIIKKIKKGYVLVTVGSFNFLKDILRTPGLHFMHLPKRVIGPTSKELA